MHRWLIALSTALVAGASVIAVGMAAPRAHAGDAPIGHIGDTLRVDNGTYIADVTVTGVSPCDPPPGFGYTREGTFRGFPGSSVERADVVVRAIRVPNAFIMGKDFSFTGVTPFADAYKPKPNDAPDSLDNVLVNAPNGAIVRGEVYWDAYRDPVSTVVLLDRTTGYHLAQWNL